MSLLSHVRSWAPFEIDALGIITLLGADSLRKTTPRLVANSYTQYLPHLASHIYADNSIAETLHGFTLYNITDGIKATDLSAWFTRWLSCQTVGWQETVLEISVQTEKPRNAWIRRISIAFTVLLLDMFLVAFPVALGDWYGFASSAGLVVTIIMRCFILATIRQALDTNAVKGDKDFPNPVKLLIALPTGKVVSVHTTRGITVQCLLTEAKPQNRQLHQAARGIIWVAFALHALTLGMASLATQLLLVVVILASTVFEVQRMGADESSVGRYLRIVQRDDHTIDSRSKAYIKLGLNSLEEESMIKWDLFPRESNTGWWQRYRLLQKSPDARPYEKESSQRFVSGP